MRKTRRRRKKKKKRRKTMSKSLVVYGFDGGGTLPHNTTINYVLRVRKKGGIIYQPDKEE